MQSKLVAAVGFASVFAVFAACSSPDEGDSAKESQEARKHKDAGATGTDSGTTGTDSGTTGTDSGTTTTDSGTTTTGSVCTNPVFVTSDPNGGWSTGGYYVHNNMWNCANYTCAETLSACAYNSWYVVANMNNNNGDGAVKSYPNVHKDYANVPISSFASITSTYGATSPHVGIYDVAYDIWLNGVATSTSNEIMIWTENYNQVPAGSKVATVTLSNKTYDVWATSGNHYIAFVPTVVATSGSLDLLAMFKWLMAQGRIPTTSTVGQIDFGVEIVSTNGTNARFDFTDFSITSN